MKKERGREGKFHRCRRVLHCERGAAGMAPPDVAMYFYGRGELGGGGFTTLYDLQFSSDTQMWKEEIAGLGAPRCPGSSTSSRRSRFINQSRARTTIVFVDNEGTRCPRESRDETPIPRAGTARASRARAISSSNRDVQLLVE